MRISPPPISPQALADLLCTIIVLCRGADADKKPFWAYLCIKPSMAQAFREARDSGSFDLEDYGSILESGNGHEVPPDVMLRMETQYGVNHHYEEELLKAAAAMKPQGAN
ncbi:MAG: hypothetical protein KGJ06_06345 [Pseudomonadota bacterium]|nr:hypothetical protein [Pseudomonadota bacterium]